MTTTVTQTGEETNTTTATTTTVTSDNYRLTEEEKEEMGIVEVPTEVSRAFEIVNEYIEKHAYLIPYKLPRFEHPLYVFASEEDSVKALSINQMWDMIASIENNSKLKDSSEFIEKQREKRRLEKEENRRKLEEAQRHSREFKEKQKRWQRGEFTPEEIEERNRKKEEKYQKYLHKTKR